MREFKIVNQRYYDEDDMPSIKIHDTEAPNFEGNLALSLIERWGMVQGADGGEDSTGRAHITLMPPEEVVDRAIKVARLTTARLRDEGWMLNLPTIAEMENELRVRKQIKESRKVEKV